MFSVRSPPRVADSTRAWVPTPALTRPPGGSFQEGFVSMREPHAGRIIANALTANLHGSVLDGDSGRLDDRSPLLGFGFDVAAERLRLRAAHEEAKALELALDRRIRERRTDVRVHFR